MNRLKVILVGFIAVLSMALFTVQGSAYTPPMGGMDCQTQIDCGACSSPALPETVRMDELSSIFQPLEYSANHLPQKHSDSPYHPPR